MVIVYWLVSMETISIVTSVSIETGIRTQEIVRHLVMQELDILCIIVYY